MFCIYQIYCSRVFSRSFCCHFFLIPCYRLSWFWAYIQWHTQDFSMNVWCWRGKQGPRDQNLSPFSPRVRVEFLGRTAWISGNAVTCPAAWVSVAFLSLRTVSRATWEHFLLVWSDQWFEPHQPPCHTLLHIFHIVLYRVLYRACKTSWFAERSDICGLQN